MREHSLASLVALRAGFCRYWLAMASTEYYLYNEFLKVDGRVNVAIQYWHLHDLRLGWHRMSQPYDPSRRRRESLGVQEGRT